MIVWTVVGGIGFYVTLSAILAFRYVHPGRTKISPPSGQTEVTLAGTPFFHQKVSGNKKGTFFLIHGYGGTPKTWTDISAGLAKQGYESYSMHLRGHGNSPHSASGFSKYEADDLAKALDTWSENHPNQMVNLVGISMGGATAWNTSALRPSLIHSVVSEGAFSDLQQASTDWLNALVPQGSKVLFLVPIFGRWISGIDASTVKPELPASEWKGRPGLIIHCENDRLMARHHADQLARASGLTIWLIPGAGHAKGKRVDPAGYLNALILAAETP